ncbi:hypothetical protein BGZ70_003370 [Mortierella alpina]|uniref:Uncharacterized protein n=1 Tax=Mortierella alpina TaxID=64518 RepID=A0A9P6LW04_MORAP|nr:hypothetical protein BGZ70_003370 [Mortierella alpina]
MFRHQNYIIVNDTVLFLPNLCPTQGRQAVMIAFPLADGNQVLVPIPTDTPQGPLPAPSMVPLPPSPKMAPAAAPTSAPTAAATGAPTAPPAVSTSAPTAAVTPAAAPIPTINIIHSFQ